MPVTALDVRNFLRAKSQTEEAAATAHAERLRLAAVDLGQLLVARFGVRRVWLFGSLAWGWPTREADIDLAVEGLAAEAYFAALGELLAVAVVPVDLVRVEDAPPGLRTRILAEGRLLHDS